MARRLIMEMGQWHPEKYVVVVTHPRQPTWEKRFRTKMEAIAFMTAVADTGNRSALYIEENEED